jgi:hypothetical protein
MFKQLLQELSRQNVNYPISEEVPLIMDAHPLYIWYSGGLEQTPKQLSIAEFMQIYQSKGQQAFDYTETVWFHPQYRAEMDIRDKAKKYENMRANFIQLLLRPNIVTDKIYLRFIDDTVGFGAFARAPIPRRSLVGIYAGVLESTFKQSVYAMSDSYLPDVQIDAERRGGLSRFFLHMPRSLDNYYEYYLHLKSLDNCPDFYQPGFVKRIFSQPRLTKAEFAKQFKAYNSDITYLDIDQPAEYATTNLVHDFYIFDGVPLFIFYSTRDVLPDEPLGINYGDSYWLLQRVTPRLFKKDGSVLGESFTCHTCKTTRQSMSKCGQCKAVSYCSSTCQAQDWRDHKTGCSPSKK